MSLQVSTDLNDSTMRVALVGELDAHTAPRFADAVAPGLASGDVRYLIVDATELSFMDSSGISELLRLKNFLAERGGSFRLDGAGAIVRRVLEITGLTEILDVR